MNKDFKMTHNEKMQEIDLKVKMYENIIFSKKEINYPLILEEKFWKKILFIQAISFSLIILFINLFHTFAIKNGYVIFIACFFITIMLTISLKDKIYIKKIIEEKERYNNIKDNLSRLDDKKFADIIKYFEYNKFNEEDYGLSELKEFLIKNMNDN